MQLITLLLGVTLLVAILLFLFPRNSKRARLHHMMNKIPGLPKYPIVGSALPYLFKKKYESWRMFLKELPKYKPVCSVWMGFMPVVSVTTPQHLEEILGNSRNINKPTMYNFLHPWLGTGLLTATGSKWHSHRKMLTPSFHFKILESFVDVFSGNSKILVEKLRQESGCGGFDVYRYITRCALDIICETAMGTSVHAQEDETSDYVASVYQIAHVVRRRMESPWLIPDMLFRLSCSHRTQDRCLKVLHGFTNRVIQERKLHRQHSVNLEDMDQERTTGHKKRVAFLDMLLDVSEGGTKLTDEEIREEVDTFMFEGHDTTTSAVCFALFLLGLHPDIQNKAYEELQSIFQGSDRSVTLKDLNEMKYLERVIKESLRLYPSVPEIGREVTSDIEIGGYTVPAGVTLHIHISVIHQDPDQYPNPEKFDPDNFLPEKVVKRHPFAYIPFSAGPRNCIGQKFAMLEEKTMLSYILRHYELCSLDNREDIKTTMEATTLLLLSVIVIAAVLFLFPRDPKRARLIQLTQNMPGPTAYPIFGTVFPFIFASRHGRMKLLEDRIKRYQPIYRARLGSTPTINITHPEHAEALLSSTKNLGKSFSYNFLHPWLGTGLLTSSGQKWHIHRKMITPTFHFKILDSFVEVFSEKSEVLVSKLQREVGSKGFDVYPYITRCALDIICETAMGTAVHAQEDVESTYVSAIHDMAEMTILRMIRPWLHPEVFFRLSSSGKRYNECLKLLHGFTNKVIKERKCQHLGKTDKMEDKNVIEDEVLGKKRRVAFLDMLLDVAEGGTKLTDEEIREEVDTFMFEGHDTTSAGMCWALYLLGLHPDVQEKVFEEQERIFQGSDRSATMKDLAEMKYLERVIKESLRLYPSVPGIGRSLTEDVQMGEFTIPAGATVHLHIYFLHRNPDHFPNPEKFDPDNFLPERVAKRHPYAYIPFSAGPRNCIGQKFALLEEKTLLSYILRHYELRSIDNREDMKAVAELVLRPENGIRLSITPRNRGLKHL